MDPNKPAPSGVDYFGDFDLRVGLNRAWFNLMRAHRKFYPRITKALKTTGIKDPIWFEILNVIDQAGAEGQPMAALEKKLFVPQYSLSRHVARLEKEGFIRREVISDGRRKQILFMTDRAKGLPLQIWPTYWDAMQEEMGAYLTQEEAYELARLLVKLLPTEDD